VSSFSASNTTLGKRAIDVLTKTSSGSSDFDEIFAHADDVPDFEELRVLTANPGSNYSQYYYRASLLLNLSSSTLWDFQFEVVLNQPSDQMKADIQAMADKSPQEVDYKISQDGNILKLYIESQGYDAFMTETRNFQTFISDNTVQGF
jgi:hypothetical protein